jgi:predicted RecB family nuclease
LKGRHDLTLLPELGRARRDALQSQFPTIAALASSEVEKFVDGKKTAFAGVGPDMLRRLKVRAQLSVSASPKPFLKVAKQLPRARTELFFDIETNPLRDFCYLHGVVVREVESIQSEQYVGFFAEDLSDNGECKAFRDAWEFLTSQKEVAIYIYSKYERTIYRKLARKFPEVCSEEEVNAMFAPPLVTDLYFDVVRPDSEWPTQNFSLKSIAKFLGFQWRDSHPSGAASIEWYERFLRTQDAADRQRILDYNEDDCRAMRVLKDAILQLVVRT